MNADLWLTGPLAERWTLVLLHFLWQGAAVVALLLIALTLVRWSSRGRYLASVAALVLMALCPLATFGLLPRAASPAGPVSGILPAASVSAAPFSPGRGAATVEHAAQESGRLAELRELLKASALELAHWDKLTGRELLQVAQPWLLVVWLGGAGLLSLRLAAGLVGMLRLAASGEPVEPEWEARLAALGQKLGLRRLPRLCVSSRVSEATVLGFLRPLVLLPAVWLTELPCDAVEAVLAHELAHLRRWDLWVNLGQRIVETLLFFHPAVWWVSRRIRVEREMCCDELAVAVTGRRREYAEALELVARQKCSGPRPAFAAGIGDDQMALLERVRNVLGLVGAQRASRAWLAGLVSLVVLAGAALASLSPDSQEAKAAEEAAKAAAADDAVALADDSDDDDEAADDVAAELRAAREELEAERQALRKELEALRAAHQQELQSLQDQLELLKRESADVSAKRGFEARGPREALRLTMGRGKLIRFPNDVHRVSVDNPSIFNVNLYSKRDVGLVALKPGTSTFMIWFDDKDVEPRTFLIRVVGENDDSSSPSDEDSAEPANKSDEQKDDEERNAEEASSEAADAEREAAEEAAATEREAEAEARAAEEEASAAEREAAEETENTARDAAEEQAEQQREADEETQAAAAEAEREAKEAGEEAAQEQREAAEEAERSAREAQEEAAEQQREAAAEQEDAAREAAEAQEEAKREAAEAEQEAKAAADEAKQEAEEEAAEAKEEAEEESKDDEAAIDIKIDIPDADLDELKRDVPVLSEIKHLGRLFRRAGSANPDAEGGRLERLAELVGDAAVVAHDVAGQIDPKWQAELEHAQRVAQDALTDAQKHAQEGLATAKRATAEALAEAQKHAGAGNSEAQAQVVKALEQVQRELDRATQEAERATRAALDDAKGGRGDVENAKRAADRFEGLKRLDIERMKRDVERQNRKAEGDADRAKRDMESKRKEARVKDKQLKERHEQLVDVKKHLAETVARAQRDAEEATVVAKQQAAQAIAEAEKQVAVAKAEAAKAAEQAKVSAKGEVDEVNAKLQAVADQARAEAEKATAAAQAQAKQAIDAARHEAQAAIEEARKARKAADDAREQAFRERQAKADKDRAEKDAKVKEDRAKEDKAKHDDKEAQAKEAKLKEKISEDDQDQAAKVGKGPEPRIVRKELKARRDLDRKSARRDRMQQLIKQLHAFEGDDNQGALDRLMELVGRQDGDADAGESLERASKQFEQRIQDLQEQNKRLLDQQRAAERDERSKREAQLKNALDEKVKALEARERELREKLRDAEQRAEKKFQEKIKERDAKEKGDKPEKKGEQAQGEGASDKEVGEYRIGPSDRLLVEAGRLLPKHLHAGDLVRFDATNVLPDQPISSVYIVQSNGTVDLGTAYGSIKVSDQTIDQVRLAVERHLQAGLRKYRLNPTATAALEQATSVQAIQGEHVVRPDGSIRLGTYGEIPVAGQTVPQAKRTIEAYLERSLERPLVSLDILHQAALRR